MPLPTLSQLRQAGYAAPFTTASVRLELPGFPGVWYQKFEQTSGGYPRFELYFEGDTGTEDICTVDNITSFLSTATYDVEVSAADASVNYFSMSEAAKTLWGDDGPNRLSVGLTLKWIAFDDYGPVDSTAGDDYWFTHSVTEVPDGYVEDTSVVFAGIKKTVRFGPWVTPAQQTADVGTDPHTAGLAPASGTTFAEKCEAGGSFADTGYDSSGFPVSMSDGVIKQVRQQLVYFDITAAIATFTDYTPTVPPGAVGLDYRGDGPSEAWLTTIDADIPLEHANLSELDLVLHARGIVPAYPVITSGVYFVPGASLAALPSAATTTIVAGTADTTSTLAVTGIPAASVADGASGFRIASVMLHAQGQIDHVGPTNGQSWVFGLDNSGSFNATLNYQPRSYRFIYPLELPPLRQHPRDDSVGGTPRQGRMAGPSTSVQASRRQGWVNTYR